MHLPLSQTPDVFTIIKRRLFVIEWREAHTFEMSMVLLFSMHSEPYCTPLSMIYRLDDTVDLIYECDSTCDVV